MEISILPLVAVAAAAVVVVVVAAAVVLLVHAANFSPQRTSLWWSGRHFVFNNHKAKHIQIACCTVPINILCRPVVLNRSAASFCQECPEALNRKMII
jgi:hypothetical protein